MSRNPGIANAWYMQFSKDIFPSDNTIHKGKRVKTPRYYETILEKSNPKLLMEIKERRKIAALEHSYDQTPERLKVREFCKTRQITDNIKRKLHEN